MDKFRKKKPDWLKIRIEYESTDISQNQLAKKYKISRNTISERVKRENWERKNAEIEQEVCNKTAKTIIEQKVDTNIRHISLISEGLEVVEELLNIYKKELQQGKFKKANAKNMDYLMSAIIKAQKGQRLALNIDAEDTGETEPEINIIKGLDIGKI